MSIGVGEFAVTDLSALQCVNANGMMDVIVLGNMTDERDSQS